MSVYPFSFFIKFTNKLPPPPIQSSPRRPPSPLKKRKRPDIKALNLNEESDEDEACGKKAKSLVSDEEYVPESSSSKSSANLRLPRGSYNSKNKNLPTVSSKIDDIAKSLGFGA